MMLVYPAAPSTRRGPMPIVTRWACAECGLEKQATYEQRRRKYCSMACRGNAMRGDRNPWYSGGRKPKIRGKMGRPHKIIPPDALRAVIDWCEAMAAIPTAEEVAKRLGLSKQAVYHAASHYRRKIKDLA